MALMNAILSTLAHGDASGYDLAKEFDASAANYWTATQQQLYRELERLEAEGLVVARVVEQTKRPNKRVFALTDAGRAALRAFGERSPKVPAVRDELLVQVDALALGDPGAVVAHVRDRAAHAEAKLARFAAVRDELLAGRTPERYLADAADIGPYLTLERGIRHERETVDWCAFVLAALASRHASDVEHDV